MSQAVSFSGRSQQPGAPRGSFDLRRGGLDLSWRSRPVGSPREHVQGVRGTLEVRCAGWGRLRAPTPPLQRREGLGAVPGSTPRDRRPPDHPYEVLGRSSVGLEVRATRPDALGPRFESRVASLDASCPPPPYIGEPRPPTSLHHHYKGDAVPQRLTPPSTKGGTRIGVPSPLTQRGKRCFPPSGGFPGDL